MVNVQEHTKYCAGKGYVMPTFEAAKQKTRVQSDMIAQFMNSLHANQAKTAQEAHRLQLPQPQTLGQRLAISLARPLLALAALFSNLQKLPIPLPPFISQAGQKLGNKLVQLTGHLLSFFFTSKKTQNKDDIEEREKRNAEDISDNDLFTKLVVNESQESNMGNS